jgi:hypothetical protein
METNIIALLSTGVVSALASFFIASKWHNKKLKDFDNINVAIEDADKKIKAKKVAIQSLHQDYELKAMKVANRIVEINELAKEKQREVNQKIQALNKKGKEVDSRIQFLTEKEKQFSIKVEQLGTNISNQELFISQKQNELEIVELRTQKLQELEKKASDIEQQLFSNGRQKEEIQKELIALKEKLQDLKSNIDLYSRIDDFINYGLYETPKYLYETPERYQAEIKSIRDKQKTLIREQKAVDVVDEIQVNGSTKTAKAILTGQVRLMLRAFNVESDLLFEKLNPSNFDRTLERIEKIAEALEKNTLSISNGISLEYVHLKFKECQLMYEYKLRKSEHDEEQRLIREQIREEQRAQREFDKAIKEAEKEELLYRNLLEKAKRQLGNSHETEKGELEANIKILELQLKEAMDKEERAKSLAQQTRRGHVYIISNIGSFGENIYKIGLTRRLDPLDRVKELGDASVPFLFDVHAIIFSDDAPAMETALHRKFNHMRVNAVNRRKEFFRVSLEEIKSAVTEIYGFEAEFKMTALAEDYYETLRLQGNTKKQEVNLPVHLMESSNNPKSLKILTNA